MKTDEKCPKCKASVDCSGESLNGWLVYFECGSKKWYKPMSKDRFEQSDKCRIRQLTTALGGLVKTLDAPGTDSDAYEYEEALEVARSVLKGGPDG